MTRRKFAKEMALLDHKITEKKKYTELFFTNKSCRCLTKKWIKLPRFCPTYEAVDFILKNATKNGCDNTGCPISVKNQETSIKQL